MSVHTEFSLLFSPITASLLHTFPEINSNNWRSEGELLARGAGFEPARPVRTTGLAGLDSAPQRLSAVLPPTRLGQPRMMNADAQNSFVLWLFLCFVFTAFGNIYNAASHMLFFAAMS